MLNCLFPFWFNYKANNKIENKQKHIEKIEWFDNILINEYSDVINQNDLTVIKQLYVDTIDRKGKLEDKAKALIVSVTLAIPFSLRGIDLLKVVTNEWLLYFTSLLFMLIIGHMILAGLLVIKTFTVQITIYTVNETKGNIFLQYRKAIILNRLSNIIRSNYISTSYECLRNSLILVVVFCMILVLCTLSLLC